MSPAAEPFYLWDDFPMSRLIDESERISSTYPCYPFPFGNCRIAQMTFKGGGMHRYLYNHFEHRNFPVATLIIGKQTFMSICPMELESHINPIRWAKGHVLVGGLGLGMYLNLILDKPEVERVTVIERNKHVIRFYEDWFKDRALDPRLKLVHGDVKKGQLRDERCQSYDFAYWDIWPYMEPEEALRDTRLLSGGWIAKRHAFWGVEKLIAHRMLESEGDIRKLMASEPRLLIDEDQLTDCFDLIEKILRYRNQEELAIHVCRSKPSGGWIREGELVIWEQEESV